MLFGDAFRKDLKKFGKERRESSDVVAALGPPGKRRKFNKNPNYEAQNPRQFQDFRGQNYNNRQQGGGVRGYQQNYGRGRGQQQSFAQPFQRGPSNKTKFGGQAFHKKPQGPRNNQFNRYGPKQSKSKSPEQIPQNIRFSIRTRNPPAGGTGQYKYLKLKSDLSKRSTSDGRSVKILCSKLAKNNKRPSHSTNSSRYANRMESNSISIKRTSSTKMESAGKYGIRLRNSRTDRETRGPWALTLS